MRTVRKNFIDTIEAFKKRCADALFYDKTYNELYRKTKGIVAPSKHVEALKKVVDDFIRYKLKPTKEKDTYQVSDNDIMNLSTSISGILRRNIYHRTKKHSPLSLYVTPETKNAFYEFSKYLTDITIADKQKKEKQKEGEPKKEKPEKPKEGEPEKPVTPPETEPGEKEVTKEVPFFERIKPYLLPIGLGAVGVTLISIFAFRKKK